MSTLFIDRFVSSLYNEKIKITDDFHVDTEILECNKDNKIPKDPNTTEIDDYPKYPDKNNNIEKIYEYELNRYLRGNMKLVYNNDFTNETPEDKIDETRINFLKKFALRNLIIDKLYETTHRRQMGISKRTVFLFPSYETINESKDKLATNIKNNYKWIFDLPDLIGTQYRFFLNNIKDISKKESDKTESDELYIKKIQDSISTNEFYFSHILTDNKSKNNPLFSNNAIIFFPVMKENEEDDVFEKRIESFLKRITETIGIENTLTEGQYSLEQKLTFNSISYAVIDDKDNEMFTDYYDKFKLSSNKKKILKSLLDKTFSQGNTIGKKTIQINNTKQIPFDNFTVEQAEKILINFTKQLTNGNALIQQSSFINFKENLIYLINLFKEYSKRSSNLEYSISATSEINTNYLRIFYRVNNMDIPVSVDLVRSGSNYLYKLTGIRLDNIENKLEGSIRFVSTKQVNVANIVYIGFLYKNKNVPNKNVYRFQVHVHKTNRFRALDKNDNEKKYELNEDIEDETEQSISGKSVMLELMKNKLTGEITFKKSGTRDTKGLGLNYEGKIEEYEILHIYEKYRWFRFNHIDGSLADKTDIRFFPDILFDKKTFIEFLKIKNNYNEKTRIPYEFLKMNLDMNLLIDYSNFLREEYNSTHIFKSSLIGRLTSTSLQEIKFENLIKSNILDIIFTPINVIYVSTPPKQSIEDKDTSKNYKIVSYKEYKPSGISELLQSNIKYQYGDFYEKTLGQVISGEDEEYKYCDLHKLYKCEIMKEFFSINYLNYLENKEKLDFKQQKKNNIKNDEIKKIIQKQIDEIDKEIKNFENDKKYIDIKNPRLFINNSAQHISMAIVSVTKEDINQENFKNFLTKNKCKMIRKNIKYDLKKIKREITIPFHSGFMMLVNGGKTIKNKIKNKKNIFIKKNSNKIKPYKNTKKIIKRKYTK